MLLHTAQVPAQCSLFPGSTIHRVWVGIGHYTFDLHVPRESLDMIPVKVGITVGVTVTIVVMVGVRIRVTFGITVITGVTVRVSVRVLVGVRVGVGVTVRVKVTLVVSVRLGHLTITLKTLSCLQKFCQISSQHNNRPTLF